MVETATSSRHARWPDECMRLLFFAWPFLPLLILAATMAPPARRTVQIEAKVVGARGLVSSKGEGEPDESDVPAAPAPVAEAAAETHPDWQCEKPATWCVHAGATNAYRKCGGMPGHFCEDSEGSSGFYPCDEKVKATWGKVACAAKGEKQQTSGQGSGQQVKNYLEP